MEERYRNTLIDYAYITIGSAITAMSIALFTNPAQIAPGGVSGIGTLLYHTLGIDVGLSILVLSLPIFLIGASWTTPRTCPSGSAVCTAASCPASGWDW